MSEMPKELKAHYQDEAEKHVDFLVEKVFRPAFIMAFIHGVKHGRADAEKGLIGAVKEELEKREKEERI